MMETQRLRTKQYMRLLGTKISNGWHVCHIHFKVMCACMLRGNGWFFFFFFCPDELYPESSHFSLLICGRELDNCHLPPSPFSEDRFLSSASPSWILLWPAFLMPHPGSKNKGFEFSAVCRNVGGRSDTQCFARELPSPESVFIQMRQNHPHTTHICFLSGYVAPLC